MLEKQKLELTWIGKYDVGAGFMPALEPRILIEYPKKSYGIVGAGPRACPNDEQLNQRGQLKGQPQGLPLRYHWEISWGGLNH